MRKGEAHGEHFLNLTLITLTNNMEANPFYSFLKRKNYEQEDEMVPSEVTRGPELRPLTVPQSNS